MNTIPTPSPTIAAVVAAAPAPWWGVPVIAGVFLLLGALLGFFFNRVNEDRKARREDALRWHGEIRSLLAEFLEMTVNFVNTEMRQDATSLGDASQAEREGHERSRTANANAIRLKASEIALVAPASVVQSTSRFALNALDYRKQIESGRSVDDLYQRLNAGRVEVVETFREELKIGSLRIRK